MVSFLSRLTSGLSPRSRAYVPAAYLMIILDETQHEEESRKEGHDKRTDGTKIGGEMGQDGERRNTYSAAVIDGCRRTSTIYVGDSIVRKTDTILSTGKDVVQSNLILRSPH